MAKTNGYSSETWGMVRALYATGKYSSVNELCSELRKTCKVVPSISAIQKRSMREKWNKTELTKKIQQTQEQMVIERFAKAGITEDTVINAVKQLILSDKEIYVDKGIQRYMDLTGTRSVARVDHTSNGEAIESNTIILLPINKFDPQKT